MPSEYVLSDEDRGDLQYIYDLIHSFPHPRTPIYIQRRMSVVGPGMAGLRGKHKVFFDSFTIEHHWPALLYELHRFDEVPT